jgi:hypothetical protein
LNKVSLIQKKCSACSRSVEKEVKSKTYNDVLSVKFSEKILGGNGNASSSLPPDLVFMYGREIRKTSSSIMSTFLLTFMFFLCTRRYEKLVTTNGMALQRPTA